MYHLHWGLRDSPFRGGLRPDAFHASASHEEALARLQFLVEQRRRIGLLLGGAGCGKSLLLAVLARHLRRTGCRVASVSLLGIDTYEFLWQLNAALGLVPERADATGHLWRKLVDCLAASRRLEQDVVLLLDDADEAPTDLISHVVRLTQCDPDPDCRQTVVLACESGRHARLGPRLLDLVELRIDIHPWEHTDTAEYVRAALRRAGREAPLFTDQALVRLHELTRGVPRRINQLADLALLAGAGQELGQIDTDTVAIVYRELAVDEAPASSVASA